MTLLARMANGWKAYILLALIPFVASVPGVFSVPALDRDESRFAQASKQMLETGDFIRIRYQEEGRHKKPAGIHWLQAATGQIGKGADPGDGQIWAYRIPSLLGAILATLATFWCGRVLVGRRSAFLGAALFGSGLLLTSEAHIAKTDAVLVFLTVLAMGALARLYIKISPIRPGTQAAAGSSLSRRQLVYLLWGALGLSFLIKGPVSLLVAALTLVVICAMQRGMMLARQVLNWRGAVLFAVLVLPWFVLVQIATDGAFLEGAVGKDLKDKLAGASEGHGGPPGYHLGFLALMFFPATLVVVPALVLAVRTLRGKALDVLGTDRIGLVFLLAWLVPTWIFFELLPTKLSHYVLPAYPALGLICGWGLVQMMGAARMSVSRWISLILFGLGGAALCFVVSPFGVDLLQAEAAGDFRRAANEAEVLATWQALPRMSLHLLMFGALSLIVAIGLGAIRRYGASTAAAIMASVLIGWHVRLVFLPGADWMQPTQMARASLADVCGLKGWGYKGCDRAPPERVQAVGYAEPSLVFTTGTNTILPPKTRIVLPDDEADYPVVYLLNIEDPAGAAAQDELTKLALMADREVIKSKPYYVLNYSNGDPVAFMSMRIE